MLGGGGASPAQHRSTCLDVAILDGTEREIQVEPNNCDKDPCAEEIPSELRVEIVGGGAVSV